MSGVNTAGFKIPATKHHMLSAQIRSPEYTWSIPRRWAAAAPSTQTGSWAVAALRKLPSATLVPTVGSKPRLAASTERALVSMAGMSRLL